MSQARVRVLPCSDVPEFQDASQFVCYGSNSDWDLDDEETAPFGQGARKFVWEGAICPLVWLLCRGRWQALSVAATTVVRRLAASGWRE